MSISKWETKSSEILIDDSWIRLRADSCRTGEGKIIDPYYVLEYPPWVTICPITKKGDIVLVRQYRHGLADILLELPCGGFEKGDEDAVAAAARELAEETGFSNGHYQEIATFAPNPSNQNNLSHVVLATELEKATHQELGYGEEIDVVLMPVEEAAKELKRGAFVQAMHVAALFYGLSHLGIIE